jgi:hypothetical protein
MASLVGTIPAGTLLQSYYNLDHDLAPTRPAGLRLLGMRKKPSTVESAKDEPVSRERFASAAASRKATHEPQLSMRRTAAMKS